MKEYTRAYSGR